MAPAFRRRHCRLAGEAGCGHVVVVGVDVWLLSGLGSRDGHRWALSRWWVVVVPHDRLGGWEEVLACMETFFRAARRDLLFEVGAGHGSCAVSSDFGECSGPPATWGVGAWVAVGAAVVSVGDPGERLLSIVGLWAGGGFICCRGRGRSGGVAHGAGGGVGLVGEVAGVVGVDDAVALQVRGLVVVSVKSGLVGDGAPSVRAGFAYPYRNCNTCR
jgi:hypothetical protein